MKSLNLPIIRNNKVTKTKVLTMNQYLKFVQFNLEQTFDKKAYLAWKKMLIVNTPFIL